MGPELRLRTGLMAELKQLADWAFEGSAAVQGVTPEQLYGMLKREARSRGVSAAPRVRPPVLRIAVPSRAILMRFRLLFSEDKFVWDHGSAGARRGTQPGDKGHGRLPALFADESRCAISPAAGRRRSNWVNANKTPGLCVDHVVLPPLPQRASRT